MISNDRLNGKSSRARPNEVYAGVLLAALRSRHRSWYELAGIGLDRERVLRGIEVLAGQGIVVHVTGQMLSIGKAVAA
jgi:hypothetical protein